MDLNEPERQETPAWVSCVDLTALSNDENEQTTAALIQKALSLGPVAAVCVWPEFVAQCRSLLKGHPIQVATVINFPSGNAPLEQVLQECAAACLAGATEIDVVIPYQVFLTTGAEAPLAHFVAAVHSAAGGRPLKCILETGAFGENDTALNRACDLALEGGADFLKTSTGKIQPGATLHTATLLAQRIRNFYLKTGQLRGLKLSGGLQRADQLPPYLSTITALLGDGYLQNKTFRIGTSKLLDSVPTSTVGY